MLTSLARVPGEQHRERRREGEGEREPRRAPGAAPPPTRVCEGRDERREDGDRRSASCACTPGSHPSSLTAPRTNGNGPGLAPGAVPRIGGPTQPMLITNELVVPVDGTVMSNRVGPLRPAGMVNATVAVPISSTVGV